MEHGHWRRSNAASRVDKACKTDDSNDGKTSCVARVSVIAALEVIAFALAALALTGLTILSVASTAVFRQGDNSARPDVLVEQMDFHIGMPSWRFWLGLPALVILIMVMVWLFSRIGERRRIAITLLYVAILQLIWICVMALGDYWYADSMMLSHGAAAVLNGDMTSFDPNYCFPQGDSGYRPDCAVSEQIRKVNLYNYFSWYPFQAGPMWWFVALYAFFGSGNVLAFQCINALAMTLIVAMLMRFGTLMGLDRIGRVSLQLLLMLCAPMLMFAPFVYTNVAGLCLALATAWLAFEALRSTSAPTSITLSVGSCLCAAVTVMVKSTFNILILALLIVIVLVSICLRRYWMTVLSVVFLPLAMNASILPFWLLRRVTGRSFGTGDGLPTLSWVAMGLQRHDGALPGWWTNESLQVFRATQGDSAALNAYATGSIKDSLSSFAANPMSALRFFATKLASEWAEPSFGTAYYSTLGNRNLEATGFLASLAVEPGRSLLTSYNNLFQTMVYALALVAVIVWCRRCARLTAEESVSLFLAVGFLGGFLCYVFWEAKSVYMLPFYLLLFPLAARGLRMLITTLSMVIEEWTMAGERSSGHGGTIHRIRTRLADGAFHVRREGIRPA